jgi:membrane-bound lytic murein transglycosylase A
MIASLETFSKFIQKPLSAKNLTEKLKESFWVYQSSGRDSRGEILFTGYYEPHLKGALERSKPYVFPLYRKPDDWVRIDLSKFDSKCDDNILVGRYIDQTIIPYFTREEIDTKASLQERGYELLWLADPIDRFFLHIQGSGRISLRDGRQLFVNYDCNNGRPYRSIGKMLIEERKISREEMSIQKIREYLKNNPQDRDRIFNHNERYVFFRTVDKGPMGALEVPLTPGRSIATDLSIFPRGAIAYVVTEKPEIDMSGSIESWRPFSRFVMNQDTGGAIKGAGRVDFFWGSGSYAEITAGHMKQKGKLYFLIKKPQSSSTDVK